MAAQIDLYSDLAASLVRYVLNACHRKRVDSSFYMDSSRGGNLVAAEFRNPTLYCV
jgi:hypothetical protein